MATPYEESVSYSPSQQILGFSPQQAAREIAQKDNSMMQLAQFSKTLGGELMKYQEQVNKEQMMEGYNLALSEPNATDVSNEIRQAGEQLKADDMDANTVAFDIIRAGDSPEVAQAVQNMSGWKRYGYAKGKADCRCRLGELTSQDSLLTTVIRHSLIPKLVKVYACRHSN